MTPWHRLFGIAFTACALISCGGGGGGATPATDSYHPKTLMRNSADKAKAWADLCLAAATLSR